MNTIRTEDGADIFYKDWGPRTGKPIVFHHGWPLSGDDWDAQMLFCASQSSPLSGQPWWKTIGWPLSGDDWDAQMLFFAKNGYRVIAHDRRGHGRSSQTAYGHDMDTYAADVAALVSALGVSDAVHIGHSTGGGEAARYVAKYGKKHAAKLALLGAVPPLLVKSASNPDGIPIDVFDKLRAGVAANRSATYWDFIIPFYGYNRPGAAVNEQIRMNWWRQAMMGAANAQFLCIKAFSETDFASDLKAIDIPVLFLHGKDDQIVPVSISAEPGSKLVKNAKLKIYPGLPHGMATTHAEQINADLLAFIKG